MFKHKLSSAVQSEVRAVSSGHVNSNWSWATSCVNLLELIRTFLPNLFSVLPCLTGETAITWAHVNFSCRSAQTLISPLVRHSQRGSGQFNQPPTERRCQHLLSFLFLNYIYWNWQSLSSLTLNRLLPFKDDELKTKGPEVLSVN